MAYCNYQPGLGLCPVLSVKTAVKTAENTWTAAPNDSVMLIIIKFYSLNTRTL